ncbi:MAG: periplasmic heavy metal sensor [Deltaproteobacteria bacterium]|nr:periplasmic heavy metal sensor [Deltaproteobacteria bacterium]
MKARKAAVGVASIAALVMFCVSFSAFAQVVKAKPVKTDWQGAIYIDCFYVGIQKVDLNEKQQEKVIALRTQYQRDMEPFAERRRNLNRKMRKVWVAPKFFGKRIIKLQEKSEALRSEIEQRTFQFRLDVIKVLRPKQRIQLMKIIDNQIANTPKECKGLCRPTG